MQFKVESRDCQQGQLTVESREATETRITCSRCGLKLHFHGLFVTCGIFRSSARTKVLQAAAGRKGNHLDLCAEHFLLRCQRHSPLYSNTISEAGAAFSQEAARLRTRPTSNFPPALACLCASQLSLRSGTSSYNTTGYVLATDISSRWIRMSARRPMT
jgi:hypothetical protein